MPARSKKQQMAAGAAKRGKRSKSSLKGASRQMARSMSEKQLREFAKTKRKKLPTTKPKETLSDCRATAPVAGSGVGGRGARPTIKSGSGSPLFLDDESRRGDFSRDHSRAEIKFR